MNADKRGVIMIKTPLSKEMLEEIRRDWEEKYGGVWYKEEGETQAIIFLINQKDGLVKRIWKGLLRKVTGRRRA